MQHDYPICKDTIILSKKSVPATKADMSVVENLLDTLKTNVDRCVGMEANMIGINKRFITNRGEKSAFSDNAQKQKY